VGLSAIIGALAIFDGNVAIPILVGLMLIPIEPRNVNRQLASLLDKAKLPQFRVHDLRHFCASLLLALGVPLKVVSDILGHTQIAITADLYTHVLPAMKREAVDLMDSILSVKKA
jgi:integrase